MSNITQLSSILITFSLTSLQDSNPVDEPLTGSNSVDILLLSVNKRGGEGLEVSSPAEDFLASEMGDIFAAFSPDMKFLLDVFLVVLEIHFG